MRCIGRSSLTPIGIDIGSRQVKAAQLRRSRKGWRIAALSSFPRMEAGADIGGEEIRHLCSIFRRQGFRGKDVVLAVPAEKLLTGILELPPRSSGAPLDQIARMELSRMHKVAPDSFKMLFWDVPASARPKESCQVLAVGCAHAEADKLLDAFERANLDVVVLDVHACAAVRACRPMLLPDPSITAILDIGWRSACLLIVYGGVVAYERVLREVGMANLLEAIDRTFRLNGETAEGFLATVGFDCKARGHELDQPSREEFTRVLSRHFDALAKELQAPFSYAVHQYPSNGTMRLLLIGGCAIIPGLTEHLASALEMEVAIVRPADLAECRSSILDKSSNPALTLAIGLAQFGEGSDND